jgi:hypothetical protein
MLRITPILFFMVCVVSEVRGERNDSFGASIDFVGGMSDRAGQGSSLQRKDPMPFYSVYPSIELTSDGEHSALDFNYHVAAERFQMDPKVTAISHMFTVSVESQLSQRSRLKLSNRLNTMPNYSIIYTLKGITPNPGGFQYLYESELYKQSNISNSTSLGLDIDLNKKSFLTFAGSGAFRHYFEDSAGRNNLSNQSRIEGKFSYSHLQTENLTWNLKYTVRQNDYQDFPTVRSHIATIGVVQKLSPNWRFNLEAGTSLKGMSHISYEVSAGIARKFQSNSFSVLYSRYAADSTGLGGTTESHQGSLAFSQTLGRSTLIDFDASAFRQSLYDYWGLRGTIAISQQLGRHWGASIGSSYMNYKISSSKRFYISLQFSSIKKRHKSSG